MHYEFLEGATRTEDIGTETTRLRTTMSTITPTDEESVPALQHLRADHLTLCREKAWKNSAPKMDTSSARRDEDFHEFKWVESSLNAPKVRNRSCC
jgi:hypothetical protein